MAGWKGVPVVQLGKHCSRVPQSLLLLLLSCLLVEADRQLQATPLDCTTLHPRCSSCQLATSISPSGKKTTFLQCVACNGAGYRPFTNLAVSTAPKSTCACLPGWFARVATPKVCEVCPKEQFCAGGVAGGATKIPCNQGTTTGATTVSTGPQSAASCVTKPGYGYKKDATAALGFTTTLCAKNTYSAGLTQKSCTACPAGLVTADVGSTAISQCSAPAGYLFVAVGKQPLPCPVGTWNGMVDQALACTPCTPVGTTTEHEASTSVADCKIAKTAGYIVQTVSGQRTVAPCLAGSWSSDFKTCTPCGEGLTTAREGASSTECLAPPGYGYKVQGGVYKCLSGSFKAGWNKGDCTSCGTNMLTNTEATDGLGLSVDQCYLPAGWGSSLDSARKLIAKQCVKGKYGASEDIFGISARPCQPCAENTVTPDQFATPPSGTPLYTSADNCVAKPGYGWSEHAAAACPHGYFKPGYNNMGCSVCGTGLTTELLAANDESFCVPLPGWTKAQASDKFGSPCNPGFVSPGGAGATCEPCAQGSTTEYGMSSDPAQCSVCSPGWGAISNSAPGEGLCKQCPPGTFSPGGTDEMCIACAPGETSPPGASDSSDCFDEFMSPDEQLAPYDFLTTPLAAWVPATSSDVGTGAPTTDPSSATECETACKAATRCQYYLFREDQDEDTDIPAAQRLANGCFFKLVTETPSADTYIAFKLWTNDYVVWEAAASEYPTDEANMFAADEVDKTDPGTCHDSCDSYASCLAVFITKHDSGWACYRVDGDYSSTGTVTSAIKAEPNRINIQPWT